MVNVLNWIFNGYSFDFRVSECMISTRIDAIRFGLFTVERQWNIAFLIEYSTKFIQNNLTVDNFSTPAKLHNASNPNAAQNPRLTGPISMECSFVCVYGKWEWFFMEIRKRLHSFEALWPSYSQTFMLIMNLRKSEKTKSNGNSFHMLGQMDSIEWNKKGNCATWSFLTVWT